MTLPTYARVLALSSTSRCWRYWTNVTAYRWGETDTSVIGGEHVSGGPAFQVVADKVDTDNKVETFIANWGLASEPRTFSGHKDGEPCDLCHHDHEHQAPTRDNLAAEAYQLRAAALRILDDEPYPVGVRLPDPADDELFMTLTIEGSWTKRTRVTALEWSERHGWRWNRADGETTSWHPTLLGSTSWTPDQVASELGSLTTRHPLGVSWA